MADRPIQITLTRSQALVLFEWMSKLEDVGGIPVSFESEQRVLWRVEGQLEKQIDCLFDPNYAQLVDEARAEVLTDNAS